MKKSITSILLFLIIIFTFSLTACGENENLLIENHQWNFSIVQSKENNGAIIACASDKKSLYEDAEVISLNCSFDNNILKLTEINNQKEWIFTCEKIKQSQTTTYSLKSSNGSNSEGLATVSVTHYDNAIDEYTLIIAIGEYAIYFIA